MTKIGAHPTAGPVFDPACLARTFVEVLAASSEGPVAMARRQAQRLARLVDSARALTAVPRTAARHHARRHADHAVAGGQQARVDAAL